MNAKKRSMRSMKITNPPRRQLWVYLNEILKKKDNFMTNASLLIQSHHWEDEYDYTGSDISLHSLYKWRSKLT